MTRPERMPEFRPRVERSPEINIEGRVETGFMEIAPDDMSPLPLKDIQWKDGTQIRFLSLGKANVPVGPFGMKLPALLYQAILQFENQGKKTIDLSRLTSEEKPICFVGDRKGFYAYNPESSGQNLPCYIVGIQPDELEDNISRLVAVYHELGHVDIYDRGLDVGLMRSVFTRTLGDMPNLAGLVAYARTLDRYTPRDLIGQDRRLTPKELKQLGFDYYGVSRSLSLFHERYAWAIAAQGFVNKGFPFGFKDKRSFVKYANFCLGTYADHYGDDSFITGPGAKLDR